MNILVIFNAKGGVAKTTTAVNVAAGMAALGTRVLLLDLDSQGNATSSMGLPEPPRNGAYELLSGTKSMSAVICQTCVPGLTLIPATGNLATVEIELALKDSRHTVLRRLLETASADVDVAVLDCPPAVSELTLSAMVAATAVLVPSAPEPYAQDGLMRTWALLTRVRGELNTDMKLIGILPTLVRPDHLEEDTGNVMAAMKAVFGSRVPAEGIPRDDRLFSDSAAYGVPALIMDPGAPASLAYLRLARQIHTRTGEGTDGPVTLRRLDDAADLREGFAEALTRLNEARAAAARLLAFPRNAIPTDPSAEVTPPAPDAEEEKALGRVALVFAGLALVLLGSFVGFATGWMAARGVF